MVNKNEKNEKNEKKENLKDNLIAIRKIKKN